MATCVPVRDFESGGYIQIDVPAYKDLKFKDFDVAERFRGAPRLNTHPETGETLCIACNLCAVACPEALIVVTSERNEKTKRKELTDFTYDLSRCMFCGLCEDACPVDALELTQDYQMASFTREGQIFDRELLEEGTTPTRYKW